VSERELVANLELHEVLVVPVKVFRESSGELVFEWGEERMADECPFPQPFGDVWDVDRETWGTLHSVGDGAGLSNDELLILARR
jgi:hypothetical protein